MLVLWKDKTLCSLPEIQASLTTKKSYGCEYKYRVQ